VLFLLVAQVSLHYSRSIEVKASSSKLPTGTVIPIVSGKDDLEAISIPGLMFMYAVQSSTFSYLQIHDEALDLSTAT